MRFVLVYQREPHAGQMAFCDVPQPTTYEERVALAKKTITELQLPIDVWIDDLGDASRAAFGDLPNAAIVMDALGIVQLKLSWAEPVVLDRTLPEIAPRRMDAPPSTVDRGFLAAVAKPIALPENADADERARAQHHRRVMLAHLAVHLPDHPDRKLWLEELAADGPEPQRAWAQRLLRPPLRSDSASAPDPR